MPSFLDALGPIIDAFESLAIPYYIGGSVASIAHGVPRTTLDVDIVAVIRPNQARTLVEQLADAYFLQIEDIQDAIVNRTSFNALHIATMIKVDVFLAPNRPFDRSKAQRARPGRVTEYDTREFNLTSPEDIVLQKLEWYNMGGKISERQWSDVQGVIRVQHTALDVGYLRRWATELHLLDLLDRALQQAMHLP